MFTYKKILSRLILPFLGLVLMSLSQATLADNSTQNTAKHDHISFSKPWVRALPPTVMHTAAYVEINNSSKVADKLLDVWSPSIKSMSVHQTKQVDGILKMMAADNTTIPPMGKLVLQPGGYHLMLMGIETPLVENETLMICFEFERAGIVHVNFPIVKK